jgi:hypothetical protein
MNSTKLVKTGNGKVVFQMALQGMLENQALEKSLEKPLEKPLEVIFGMLKSYFHYAFYLLFNSYQLHFISLAKRP